MNVATPVLQSCLGVVLAGGKSSRMGQNKAKLQRHNQDMLSYSKSVLTGAGCSQVVVSGGEHGIDDLVANLGPLGGIQSIISQCQPQALLILPVDLPLMTATELSALKQAGELSQRACYFNDHYLPLYLPVNAFVAQFFQQRLTQALNKTVARNNHAPSRANGELGKQKRNLSGPSVRSLLAQVPHTVLAPKNSQTLFNTNTPEQWQQATHLLSLQRKSHV
ncbi:molybdopterin-guanine dinucleotide biosynthesis protein A [Colwellia chukchiensis]|uniref:Molybdopterin-guanine dinucleotide biosynthesis protein A n=1 Tax=Colwellia chukchiensis TaxID=641665 RepID=A0A1H7JLV2_9GAMM|nr:molybdenum cofactor guanylyltransferase [Colwellia chukchiensis]SEK74435.1 molybdopterin-guanine dinucleotide biosynthesis protein A [Colwellia chukchiensis]